jgi:DNA-binding NarL/FixJ family response regulator
VASEAQHPVVILYKHALLGEGIATYLRTQIGVEARVASAHDREAVTSALTLGPAVVIFESSDPFQQFDLATLAPHAVLIDVSTVITRGSVLSPGVAGLEQILQAVRDCSTVARPVGTRSVQPSLYRKSTVRRMGSPQ